MALFRIPHIAILARFQRILRLFRDYSKYRGFIAVIGKIAILLRFYKISRYRDDRDKVTSLIHDDGSIGLKYGKCIIFGLGTLCLA